MCTRVELYIQILLVNDITLTIDRQNLADQNQPNVAVTKLCQIMISFIKTNILLHTKAGEFSSPVQIKNRLHKTSQHITHQTSDPNNIIILVC